MPEPIITAVAAVIALAAGLVIGFVLRRLVAANAVRRAEHYAERLVGEGRAKEKEILPQGEGEGLPLQRAGDEEALEQREAALEERGHSMDVERAQLAETHQRQLAELERVSGLSVAEARSSLIQHIVDEARSEASQQVREAERRAHEESEERARRILTTVMQRIAADHTSEATVTVVHLPSEEMKGRIIGREGRNIRALEQATGVDLIIDDTPEAVVLSGFDPVRREVARMALTKLISDGRIHPGRIEETVAKCRAEIEAVMRQAGEQAAYDAGVPGLHPELIKLLGRLKYRTSYGQNVLNHVVETSRLP